MIRRRQFLFFLAAITAMFGSARASRRPGMEMRAANNNRKLVLHKGWILRADDPRDNE